MNEQLHLPGLWLWQGKTAADIWASRVSTPPPQPSPSRPHSRLPYLAMLALLLILLSLVIVPTVSDSAVEPVEPLPAVSAQADIPALPKPLAEAVPVPVKKPHPPRQRSSPLVIHGVLTPPDDWR